MTGQQNAAPYIAEQTCLQVEDVDKFAPLYKELHFAGQSLFLGRWPKVLSKQKYKLHTIVMELLC